MEANGPLTHLKTLLVMALRRTFDAEYPVEDLRGLHIDIEFPVAAQSFPGVWVDFDFTGPLQAIGVGHVEYAQTPDPPAAPTAWRKTTRWEFLGTASFTISALTSLERDRLFDEVVRVIAFSRQDAALSEFRNYIEDNPFVACTINFDQIHAVGKHQEQGTPWGSDEAIYEVTLTVDVKGEFVSDDQSATLLPLASVAVYSYRDDETDPAPGVEDEPLNPYAWQ